LIEDGVYGAIKGSVVDAKIRNAINEFSVYVLGPDIVARGMSKERVIDGVTVVDYEGFVDLVESHDNIQAWL
jgi:tRNA 2-thiouridine synthesizing protein B